MVDVFLAFLCALCQTIRVRKRLVTQAARRKRAKPRLVTKAHQLERDEAKAALSSAQRIIRRTNGKK
jgi:hypothetical protein